MNGIVAWASVVAVLLGSVVVAEEVPASRPPVQFRSTHVRDNVHVLTGAGGNVGVVVGGEGLLLIDSEYAGLTDQLVSAAKAVSDQPIRLVVNTHWHFDHVGGNEPLARAGATIIAHENVHRRLSADQYLGVIDRHVQPAPPIARPAITFDRELTLHWGGDEIRVLHLEAGHTDGDSIVIFPRANVMHIGDLWFGGGAYPYIDVNAGGSIDGVIAGLDRVLGLANDDTKIIPGHGPVSDAAALRTYKQMLLNSRERVERLIKEGKSREETIAAKPTADLDASWSRAFPPDAWIGILYDSLTNRRVRPSEAGVTERRGTP